MSAAPLHSIGQIGPLIGQGPAQGQNQGPAPRPAQSPVSDDARNELVGAAQRHERRNRPRYLIVLAILNATLSSIYTAAVYLYAAEGATGGGFQTSVIQGAFRPKTK